MAQSEQTIYEIRRTNGIYVNYKKTWAEAEKQVITLRRLTGDDYIIVEKSAHRIPLMTMTKTRTHKYGNYLNYPNYGHTACLYRDILGKIYHVNVNAPNGELVDRFAGTMIEAMNYAKGWLR